MTTDLLKEIETFLAETAERSPEGKSMSKSYFGWAAARNCRLVERLERGDTVTLKTVDKVRAFITARRKARA